MGSEILGLARYGLDPIAWRKVRVFFGKGDIYIPVPVIGKGGRGGEMVVSVVRTHLGCIVGQKVRVLRDDW